MRQMTGTGRRIEDSSFAVVDREAWPHDYDARQWQVVRRIIHATADFEFKHLTRFSRSALDSGIAAIQRGAPMYVDVKMIRVGTNARRLAHFGIEMHCFVSDEDVIARAQAANSTRSIEGVRKAWELGLIDGAIVAVGNAPTALLELIRLVREEGAAPALVIGMPVGFVSAAESKEALLEAGVPYILTRGRKGGSTIVVATLHALLAMAAEDYR